MRTVSSSDVQALLERQEDDVFFQIWGGLERNVAFGFQTLTFRSFTVLRVNFEGICHCSELFSSAIGYLNMVCFHMFVRKGKGSNNTTFSLKKTNAIPYVVIMHICIQ